MNRCPLPLAAVALVLIVFPAMRAVGKEPVRVACVGDSITEGARLSAPGFESYPAQLERMLDAQWEVRNFGASGRTVLNLEGQSYRSTAQFRAIAEYRPEVIVVMLGTNDTKPENWKFKERFAAEYEELTRQLQALQPTPKLFLCWSPAVYGTAVSGINQEGVLAEQSIIKGIAQERGAALIDVFAATTGHGDFFSDGVHPNAKGAYAIAATVYRALTGKDFEGTLEPEIRSTWRGWERIDFAVEGRAGTVVFPKAPAAGNPWIWRTEFFGAFPQADLALLAKGYHVAYVDVQNLYGAPIALEAMDRFYDAVRGKYGLAERVVLEGFSRGGLFAFNWAARHPERVASMYVDAPVCDFKSWPAGKGRGAGSPGDWAACKRAYGLSEEEALVYGLNPIDNLVPLAQAKIAILSVCGEADTVVPFAENTGMVESRYRQLGGEIKVIRKPGVGHHPHSLDNPEPIVEFILAHQDRKGD